MRKPRLNRKRSARTPSLVAVAAGYVAGLPAVATQIAATSWTALHQWTPLEANITLVRRPSDAADKISARWRLLHITDNHISLGEASDLHQSGTRRMHGAFRSEVDRHLEPGTRRAPAETFRRLLDLAVREQVDAIVLTGDVVNFPHNASIQYVWQALSTLRGVDGERIPTIFTAGNHDWLVEGLGRARKEQRSQFRREFLRPLYSPGLRRSRGKDVAHRPPPSGWAEAEDVSSLLLGARSSHPAAGVASSRLLLLALDNSHLEVSSAQADFIWRELARGLPTLLAVHVPFMLPDSTPKNGKNVLCGDPRYSHDGDNVWHIERRERWPRSGAPASTKQFIEDLVQKFGAPHGPLLGVLGGHEHVHRVDTVGITRSAPPLQLQCDNTDSPSDGQPPRCEHKETGHRLGLPLHEGLAQYVTLPGFEGGHRKVEVRDARQTM